MAQQDLLGSDKLNVAYQKINENFDELYAGGGGGGGGASDLFDLTDVAITTPIGNDQALVYDNVANKWKNEDIPRDLNALSDVDLTIGGALTQFQVLQYNGTLWVNSKVSISELNGVTISSPADKEVLQYNGTTWVNSQINISELNDVNASTPAPSQVLQYSGATSKWEAVNPPFSLNSDFVEFQILSAIGGV